MGFLEEFKSRGYFYQCTDLEKLKAISDEKSIAFYVGFDCTAESLHVGNLMQIMILRMMQKYGHKPIVIVGGATTKIGDPSGKDETRKMLTDEDIERNIIGIKKSLSKFIKFGDGKSDAIILNNSVWLESLLYIGFLRDFGREFSVNKMLTMDSVKLRLSREQNLTFLEFNYMLLQAYDFMYLAQNYDCILQLGGSDQWGNIVTGSELIRKKLQKPAFGLTTPLLTTSSGAKMGKSASGAIWINEGMLSPYDYYQYWRNTEDADVVRFAKLYGEFDELEQQDFEKLAASDINEAKKILAFKLCELCHGEEKSRTSLDTARKVFEEGGAGEGLEVFYMDMPALQHGMAAYELFALSGLSASKSEARKLIRGGGARVNNIKIEDENHMISAQDLIEDDGMKLSSGKKNHLIIKVRS